MLNDVNLERVDKPFKEIPPGMGALAILGKDGDTKHIWNKNKPEEVAAACALFKSLTSQRYLAFAVKGDNGEKGEQVREFDPSMERLIFLPAMQGG